MINNEQFISLSAEMITSYLKSKELDSKDVKLSLIDTTTILNTKKGLFVTNKANDVIFEIVFDMDNKKAHLTSLKVDGNLSFDININQPQKEEKE